MRIKICTTAAVSEKGSYDPSFYEFVCASVARYLSSDWGDISEDDAEKNATDPLGAMGAYTKSDGHKIWIKRDGNLVTVLFPSEY